MPIGVLLLVLAPVTDTLLFLLNDSSLSVSKRCAQAASTLYRVGFHALCIAATPESVAAWLKLVQLKAALLSLDLGTVGTPRSNDGLRVLVVKFFQTLVLCHSYRGAAAPPDLQDVSLDTCPAGHPFLQPADLQRESVDAFAKLLALIAPEANNAAKCSSAVTTAAIYALHPIIRARPPYVAPAMQALISWMRTVNPGSTLTLLGHKNIERAIRNEFLALLGSSVAEVKDFIPVVTEILVGLGVKGYEIATRVKARMAGKRAIVDEEGAVPLPPPPGPTPSQPTPSLANFDVQAIPLAIAVDVVVQALASTPADAFNLALTHFGETLGIPSIPASTAAASSVRDPRRRDPRAKTEPSLDDTALPPPSETSPQGAALDLFRQFSALASQPGPVPPPTSAQPHVPAPLVEPEFDPASAPLAVLSADEARATWRDAVARVMDLDAAFDIPAAPSAAAAGAIVPKLGLDPRESVAAARTGWMLLLVRLVTGATAAASVGLGGDEEWGSAVQELRDRLFEFVVEAFRARYELAILWLHEEYRLALLAQRKLKKSGGDGTPLAAYETLFQNMLQSLRGEARTDGDEGVIGLDPKDRTFTKFLIDVPMVPPTAIVETVKAYCEDSERMALGFSTLRDLINLRPALRAQCLDMLQAYCIHADKAIRTNAIFNARRWIAPDHPTLGPSVEEYATSMLRRLSGSPPQEDAEEEEDGGAAWEEVDAVRHFELFFGLTLKKPELLLTLARIFPQLPSEVSKNITQHIEPLIKRMIANAVALEVSLVHLCTLVRSFPPGSDNLIKRVLEIVTSRPEGSSVEEKDMAGIPGDLVNAVLETVDRLSLDGTYVLYVLPSLNKQQVMQYLPGIISVLDGTEESEKLVGSKLFKMIAKEEDALVVASRLRGPGGMDKVTPAEVMVEIHTMEGKIDLRKCLEGTKLCLKHPEVFTKDSLSIVIGKLVESPKIPTLFMRTALEVLRLYPDRDRFIGSILSRLVARSVWKNPSLWKGFVMCCRQIGANAFDAMLKLPRPQFEDVVTKEPTVAPLVRDFLLQLPPGTRIRYAGFISALDDQQQQPSVMPPM
ncbi:Symplekin tight junction protein C terminal-domain-containing protein [Chytriomyces sp. MP71]|nr:Symplekin tight junction protein C terminal-domain-containing protein [Chytriomyces sp. MP71]